MARMKKKATGKANIATPSTVNKHLKEKKKATGKNAAAAEQILDADLSPLCIGGVLRPARLLAIVKELRTLVINNASRIEGFRPIADGLGSIETRIVDKAGLSMEDDKQGDAFKKPNWDDPLFPD